MAANPYLRRATVWVLALVVSGAAGCVTCQPTVETCDNGMPRELSKTMLPPYTIEPPDILLIDAVRVIPKPPYRIAPLDVLLITANGLPTAPITGAYAVDTDGTVNFGPPYHPVIVVGLTLEEAKKAIEDALKDQIVKPEATVYLGQSHALQQLRGDHLVRPDGTVGLGTYGDVNVTGKTLAEAKAAIEQHLSQYLLSPEVSVDVYAYNSKVFFVIYDGGGYGQQIVRLPITGNDTVLEAVSMVNGLSSVANKRRIWVARPVPACSACDDILPVDWNAITMRGRTETNYQLFPGDRLYVEAEPLVTLDTWLGRIISPMERVFGITLLGNGTIQNLKSGNNGSGSGTGGF
ncbi:MAG TPA: polysaccharide biosynthesis/export family protein [Gemmataceae bacterium]|nr:polysaccharide biosynthesis/export family protein [Gemmataceae bacterium]